jgi:hypothetical protein
METAVIILRAVRSQAMDANLKIGIENHEDIQAWRTRLLVEDPITTVEELVPYAVTFRLRDSVVYQTQLAPVLQVEPKSAPVRQEKPTPEEPATIRTRLAWRRPSAYIGVSHKFP